MQTVRIQSVQASHGLIDLGVCRNREGGHGGSSRRSRIRCLDATRSTTSALCKSPLASFRRIADQVTVKRLLRWLEAQQRRHGASIDVGSK